jgi:carbohydrate-selective porin OprB
VLPSSDDENSDNEDSPLIRPEGPELHDGKLVFDYPVSLVLTVDEERTVGWAAAFSRSSGTQRARGPSVSSYTSLDGEVNPVYAEGTVVQLRLYSINHCI